jgi:hypothetical protein
MILFLLASDRSGALESISQTRILRNPIKRSLQEIWDMELKTSIDLFIAEFLALETHFVRLALQSLSDDAEFVEHTEKLLDLEARLKLLKRMALVRKLDPELIGQLDCINSSACQLREKRDVLDQHVRTTESNLGQDHSQAVCAVESRAIHALPIGELTEASSGWVPTIEEINECRQDTTKLQASLQSLAEHVNRYRLGVSAHP